MPEDRGPEEPGEGDEWEDIGCELEKIGEDCSEAVPEVEVEVEGEGGAWWRWLGFLDVVCVICGGGWRGI